MDDRQVMERVKALVEPLLTRRGVDLVEVSYRYEGQGRVLRLLVDTARGVKVGELSALNQSVGALLDEQEVVPGPYTLEVSSPGLDRPLRTQADFERVIGRRVRVRTRESVQERTEHLGEVLGANEEAVVIRLDSGDKRRIPLEKIARAVQEIDFR